MQHWVRTESTATASSTSAATAVCSPAEREASCCAYEPPPARTVDHMSRATPGTARRPPTSSAQPPDRTRGCMITLNCWVITPATVHVGDKVDVVDDPPAQPPPHIGGWVTGAPYQLTPSSRRDRAPRGVVA